MPQVYANSATFDGVDLNTINGLTILAINPYLPAKRNITSYDLARTSKKRLNSAFYTGKDITIRVGISRSTRALAEVSLDSLMAMLQGIDKYLVLSQSGSTRRYSCVFADCILNTEGGAYIEAELVFTTSDHFGYDVNDTLLNQVSGFTSGQKTDPITVAGSAPWQVPVTTITLSAVGSASSSSYVTFGNDSTGQTLTITRLFVAGDVIEIDALNQTVKVNGTEVVFTGAIPEWAVGPGFVTYADNLTSRTMSYTMRYKKRYV